MLPSGQDEVRREEVNEEEEGGIEYWRGVGRRMRAVGICNGR